MICRLLLLDTPLLFSSSYMLSFHSFLLASSDVGLSAFGVKTDAK